MSLREKITIRYEHESCLVASYAHIIFVVGGKSPASVESHRGQCAACNAHARRVGEGKLVEIVLLDDEVPLPSSEARAVLEANVPVITPYYACVATVFEGSGFRASVIRGLLTSFSFLSRTPFPQKVFAEASSAAEYVAAHQGLIPERERLQAAEVAEVTEAVRELAKERGILSGR